MTATLPRARRTEDELRAELRAAIDAGRLGTQPTADAIRTELRCAPAAARALRDALREVPPDPVESAPDRTELVESDPIRSADPTPDPVHPTDSTSSRRWHTAVWVAGLLVALIGAALTSIGGWAVAHGAGVPAVLAGGYPAITDGLALTAYAATPHLEQRRHRAYAWLVVVLCAGLSCVAQAIYGMDGSGLSSSVDSRPLRAAVHGWPAVAVAIAAHLVWLVRRSLDGAGAAR